MILAVRHRTTYAYTQPVSVSHHVLRLAPRATATQLPLSAEIDITPQPSARLADTDYFGNATVFVTIEAAHERLTVEARSRVELRPQARVDPARTMPWDRMAERLAKPRAREALLAAELSHPSTHVPILEPLLDYARPSFRAGRPLLEAALDLTRRIHVDFRYDSTATTLATLVEQAFAQRAGVCQDFAHIEIACLRALGLPARYVSGYLLTRPPEGRPRLTGSDASHAWLAVWMGDDGWVDLDPTNDVIPGEEHVTLAWGRDYADVAPVSGVLFGGGEHSLAVAVDVDRVD